MKPRAYYNEFDPAAAAWLRELIKQGLVMDGEVDTRSIADVEPTDLVGFTRCHFFAGIGGWDYALALAGWPVERPVWTGSCPCQPFSAAGRQEGHADARHLWPVWERLIRECRPATVFGEQVASPLGRDWLAGVRSDLEALGYAVGAADLCAAGVGAPHIRQRLFWVADSNEDRRGIFGKARLHDHGECGNDAPRCGADVGMGDQPGGRLGVNGSTSGRSGHADEPVTVGGMVDGFITRLERLGGDGGPCVESRRLRSDAARSVAASGATRGAWADADWLLLKDGSIRPVESGTFPLAYGVSARVGRLRGYGNAIVPEAAAAFIESYIESRYVGDAKGR